ncbi:aminotransferase class III-fold pyridoxal phosphate-dependent enzyme [Planktomarina temperata]|nr:aminotransferase class III-fold pyridoxal phosphate-dependent enzyme [Planktomarina temperata]
MKKNSGKALWKIAKKLMPGGNMFLSKRPERFLPLNWPVYFSNSKGCIVYDLDKNQYYDMIMSIGTNVLGYSNPSINNSVIKAIKDGTMSTLNCPEEPLLAKKLLQMHGWAGQAKFARSGGEANAIAIRVARSFTGKDKVAICGYHGWHDWYLAANLSKRENLKEHLLPGLKPKGVPKNLKNTIYPFSYNNFDQLLSIVKKHDIGTIKMEVTRNYLPKDNFLKKVRKLATQKKIVLIFDECTSGFRQTFGGIHKYFGVNPDLATFGKTLGNGHPITAIIGKKKIMNSSQSSFISSTFWSERVGFVAALKTLEIMKKTQSWKKITKNGNYIKSQWDLLAKKNKIKIEIEGIPAICSFKVISKYSNYYNTYITQQMLSNGFLANNFVYVSTAHTKLIIKNYLKILDVCFLSIGKCERGEETIKKLLKGPVSEQGFIRLN